MTTRQTDSRESTRVDVHTTRRILTALLLVGAIVPAAWMKGHATPTPARSVRPGGDSGAAVYQSLCSSCHQPTGLGLPSAFPPLAGDPVVTAKDASDQIRSVLFGVTGKIIGGVSYGPMPPWAAQLSDAQVAAVINHERTSWGNHAPTITARQVAMVRRTGPKGAVAGRR